MVCGRHELDGGVCDSHSANGGWLRGSHRAELSVAVMRLAWQAAGRTFMIQDGSLPHYHRVALIVSVCTRQANTSEALGKNAGLMSLKPAWDNKHNHMATGM